MIRLRQLLSRYALDVLVVVAALTSALGTALRTDPDRPTGPVLWFEVVAVAVLVLALLLRRRYPFGAPAATWVLSTSLSFLDGRLIVSQGGVWLAGLGATLLLGNLRGTMHQRVGLAIVLGGSALIVSNDPLHTTGDFLFVPVPFLVAWLVGFALRQRADQTAAAEERAARAEREREFAARVAVAEERGRIARELHDVVAHAVSVMVLQVGAVRHRMPEELDEDREALKNVEQAGRTALTEMRRLLGAMRHDGDALELEPHPGLGNLDTLIDDVRAAGLPVRLHVEGEPIPLPPALDLSAYRILQEGLTNALKHAGAQRADVSVHYGIGELEVQVRDDGRGPGGSDGLGHGLVGIGERVKIYGGQMSAGAGENGGFVLRARLPLEGLGA